MLLKLFIGDGSNGHSTMRFDWLLDRFTLVKTISSGMTASSGNYIAANTGVLRHRPRVFSDAQRTLYHFELLHHFILRSTPLGRTRRPPQLIAIHAASHTHMAASMM